MTFTCHSCKNVYESVANYDDMIEKFKKNFPNDNPAYATPVCRKCYKIAMRALELKKQHDNWIRYATTE